MLPKGGMDMKLFIDLFISSVGLGYFIYGKKSGTMIFLLFGLCMMFYSYFVNSVWVSLFVGLVLLLAPFLLKRIY